MEIRGVEGMGLAQVEDEIDRGARFVVFQFCVSILVMTFKRESKQVYFLRPGESAFLRSWGENLLTVLLGWWGIPWGPIYSIQSLYVNATGGHDVTYRVLQQLSASQPVRRA